MTTTKAIGKREHATRREKAGSKAVTDYNWTCNVCKYKGNRSWETTCHHCEHLARGVVIVIS